ncbi:MAG: DUF167 domain-containing protein [Candidatus Falkowbacteria bacterium]|nr:DUF167 domain-containing protein [Candidatus Falkowbacteria bacterium]
MKKLKLRLDQELIIYLKVKINPSSNENAIKRTLDDGTIKINIVAPAKNNKANLELIDFLAKNLAIPRDNVIIISGKINPIKLIKIQKNYVN